MKAVKNLDMSLGSSVHYYGGAWGPILMVSFVARKTGLSLSVRSSADELNGD